MPRELSTQRWAKLSRQVVAEEPVCRLQLPGCTIVSTAADHIVSRVEGGPVYERRNLQGACKHCNTAKENRRRKAARALRTSRRW